MKTKQILFLMVIFVAALSACIPDPPNPGFRIHTYVTSYNLFLFPHTELLPNTSVNGHVFSVVSPNPTGTLDAFIGSTNSSAYYDVRGGKAPAIWNIGESSGPCAGSPPFPFGIAPGEDVLVDCKLLPFLFSFAFSPSTIERDSPPSSITINGEGLSVSGGMPTVEYYNTNGVLIAQNTAFQVAPDGTELTAPTPDLSSMASGGYMVVVRNPDGSIAGNSVVVIFDYYGPPSDPPPDPGSCGPEQVCPIDLIVN